MSDYFCHESSYIDDGVEIGSGTKIWHFSHILKGSKIGSNCSIGQNVVIGPNVKVGDNCKIQNNVSIYEGLVIHDNVFLGPSCVFTNVINPRANIVRKHEFKKTIINHGASVGANATIICGNTIGSFAMVGAGALVTKDVSDHSLVIGSPAKHYKWISKSGMILDSSLVCPDTAEKYAIKDGRLELLNS
tara:strand:- start:9135 stop:9701 length:567 start_codon:yes stop_codon:yes gene_type:complete